MDEDGRVLEVVSNFENIEHKLILLELSSYINLLYKEDLSSIIRWICKE